MNKEKANEAGRAYYWRNRDKCLEKSRRYRMLPDYQSHMRQYLIARKITVLTHYGNGKLACVKCGFTNLKALTIDHINGREATEHKKRRINGIGIYGWLIREGYPDGYQTLCMNCQFIKREDNHEYSNQYTVNYTSKGVLNGQNCMV